MKTIKNFIKFFSVLFCIILLSGCGKTVQNPSKLDYEYKNNSQHIEIDTQMANEVLEKLNKERKTPLIMDTSSDLYKAATIRISHMVLKGETNPQNDVYGSLESILKELNLNLDVVENASIDSDIDSDGIHNKFQSVGTTKETRMNEEYKNCAILVAHNGEQTYILEWFAR